MLSAMREFRVGVPMEMECNLKTSSSWRTPFMFELTDVQKYKYTYKIVYYYSSILLLNPSIVVIMSRAQRSEIGGISLHSVYHSVHYH